MKVKSAIRKICHNCKIVRKGKRNYVYCATNPRHKQRQGFSTLESPQGVFNYQQICENTPKLEENLMQDLFKEAAQTAWFSKYSFPVSNVNKQ